MVKYSYNYRIVGIFFVKKKHFFDSSQCYSNKRTDNKEDCIYNHKICSCKTSRHFYKICIGKEKCSDFVSKSITKRKNNDRYKKSNVNVEDVHMIENIQSDLEENDGYSLNETPEEKFKRLAKTRIDNVVDDLRKIANLANKSYCSYTDDDVSQMFEHLDKALEKTKQAYKKEAFMEEFRWK